MEFGPDDLVMLAARYLLSFLAALAVSIAILAMLALGRRRLPRFRFRPALTVCLVLAPLAYWVAHSASTSELTYTLTLLNSESSRVAERTYVRLFRAQVRTLDQAVGLAVSRRQAPNVRFYASCLIAEMLATNNDAAVVARTLRNIENTPIIQTEFIGGNMLTDKFYVPGHEQLEISVRKIVEQRLRDLRKTGEP